MAIISSIGGRREETQKFKVSLRYIVSLKPVFIRFFLKNYYIDDILIDR